MIEKSTKQFLGEHPLRHGPAARSEAHPATALVINPVILTRCSKRAQRPGARCLAEYPVSARQGLVEAVTTG